MTKFTCLEAARDEAQFLANETGKAHIVRYCQKSRSYTVFQMGTRSGPATRTQEVFFSEH